jgi:hypothetical protein
MVGLAMADSLTLKDATDRHFYFRWAMPATSVVMGSGQPMLLNACVRQGDDRANAVKIPLMGAADYRYMLATAFRRRKRDENGDALSPSP